jgi:hypothetical protein
MKRILLDRIEASSSPMTGLFGWASVNRRVTLVEIYYLRFSLSSTPVLLYLGNVVANVTVHSTTNELVFCLD